MRLDKNGETALRWIRKHIKYDEFYDGESTDQEMRETIEFFAYEISLFARNLAPKTPISIFINRNYKTETFFSDHERVAARYYGC